MNILTNMIGVAALSCFSIRVLLQWFLSEKQRKVVTPSLYWVFSLIGCYLYFTYGWLKSDIAILAGQFMSVFIYIWNLVGEFLPPHGALRPGHLYCPVAPMRGLSAPPGLRFFQNRWNIEEEKKKK